MLQTLPEQPLQEPSPCRQIPGPDSMVWQPSSVQGLPSWTSATKSVRYPFNLNIPRAAGPCVHVPVTDATGRSNAPSLTETREGVVQSWSSSDAPVPAYAHWTDDGLPSENAKVR
jgi:hypothetical protein